jgi:hypothetical protein
MWGRILTEPQRAEAPDDQSDGSITMLDRISIRAH